MSDVKTLEQPHLTTTSAVKDGGTNIGWALSLSLLRPFFLSSFPLVDARGPNSAKKGERERERDQKSGRKWEKKGKKELEKE